MGLLPEHESQRHEADVASWPLGENPMPRRQVCCLRASELMTDHERMIADAILRNSGLVLSLPSAGMLRHCKSRFLAECEDGSIWIEGAPGERLLIAELIGLKRPSGISFKNGAHKVMFAAPILEHRERLQINTDMVVEAIRIAKPEQVKAVQRRNNYRVAVPGDAALRVRVWRIAERTYLGDRPMAAQEIKATLKDISTGGLGATLVGEENQPPRISTVDRLRLEIDAEGVKFLLEGQMIYPTGKVVTPAICAGIQFKAMERNLEGRKIIAALTRIVGELQRAEARRYRLGITAA